VLDGHDSFWRWFLQVEVDEGHSLIKKVLAILGFLVGDERLFSLIPRVGIRPLNLFAAAGLAVLDAAVVLGERSMDG
jgi:hypothetical protein